MAGCASKTEQTGASTSSGSDGKVIKIVTQSPLSGGSATQGEAIKLGAQLQIEEQKKRRLKKAWI
ncbi:hypothetical protein GCM10020331_050310 [Ectobacillus funiculus]